MINTGKCPKCESTITNVKIEGVDVYVSMNKRWRGVSYICPSCNSVLSVQIDPVALKTDIINGVVKKIKGLV